MDISDRPPAGGSPPSPAVDFAAFGETERQPLSRIQHFAAGVLARNWQSIPHVTHHDEADVTELEELRKELSSQASTKITLLAFAIKAAVAALREFPRFNASLDADGRHLVLRKYFHVGFAVDTPMGLLVPVIRDCDRKSLVTIAGEIEAMSAKARTKGLAMTEMSGGCFTISSLGSIGGTGFTPIINAPEVAILGLARTKWQPFPDRERKGIVWRRVLPLSLSYDHRVINGADAARFTRYLADQLGQPRTLAHDSF